MAEGDGYAAGLSFGDFLAKMKDPAAADLVRNIKSFIRQFEDRPAGAAVDPEADSAKVQAFLEHSAQQFRQHPVWRGCQPEVLDQAVEGLEKYVMSKVWRQTFGAWQEDRERDERYQRLMQALGFVDLPTLMGADIEADTNLLALAQGETLKMDRYKAPRDKLLCLVNVKTMVENIVQLAVRGGANIGGADAFFPVFLYVIIRSRLPHLASNVEYIKRFRMRTRLSGQFDYMLCNLESAAMYLDTVNYEHLHISQDQFLAHLAAAGIPEAHLELRRLQQQQQQQQDGAAAVGTAAGLAAAPQQDGAATAGAAAGQHVQAAQASAAAAAALPVQALPSLLDSDGTSVGIATAATTAEQSRTAEDGQQQQAVASAAGTPEPADAAADVLAGLQLADAPSPQLPPDDAEGLAPVQASLPSTPKDAGMAGPADGSRQGEGGEEAEGMLGLTPLAGTSQSPVVLEPAGGAGTGDGSSTLDLQQEQQAGTASSSGSAVPRELSFEEAAARAAVATTAAAASAAREQQQQQQQQAAALAWEQQAAAAVAVAAMPAVQYFEPALIEEMVAEGTRYVLAAEAAGVLQARYPYMYAQPEDLALADVQAVLVGYKELLLRYEALSRALQQQLGLDSGTPAAGAAAAVPAAATSAAGELSPNAGRRPQSAPPAGAAAAQAGQPGGAGSRGSPTAAGAAAAAAGNASPTARWSPGGILQRIAKTSIRSITPPKDRGGSREAAAVAAADGAAQQQAAMSGSRSPAGRGAGSSKQGQHPFFSTLFGSSGSLKAATTPPQQQAAPPGSSDADAAAAVAAAGEPGAALQQQQQQTAGAPAAGDSLDAGPEPSFADDLLQPLMGSSGEASTSGTEAAPEAAAAAWADAPLQAAAGAELASAAVPAGSSLLDDDTQVPSPQQQPAAADVLPAGADVPPTSADMIQLASTSSEVEPPSQLPPAANPQPEQAASAQQQAGEGEEQQAASSQQQAAEDEEQQLAAGSQQQQPVQDEEQQQAGSAQQTAARASAATLLEAVEGGTFFETTEGSGGGGVEQNNAQPQQEQPAQEQQQQRSAEVQQEQQPAEEEGQTPGQQPPSLL